MESAVAQLTNALAVLENMEEGEARSAPGYSASKLAAMSPGRKKAPLCRCESTPPGFVAQDGIHCGYYGGRMPYAEFDEAAVQADETHDIYVDEEPLVLSGNPDDMMDCYDDPNFVEPEEEE